MSLTDVDAALQLIRDAPKSLVSGPRDESLIRRAESALEIVFPPSYRRFLLAAGYVGIRGREFYGVFETDFVNSSVPDAIWLTLNERRVSNSPRPLVFVGDTGYGSFYVLDTARRTPGGECPVVEWWPGSGDDTADCKVIAEDFGAFFLMLVQEALQPDDQSRAD